MTQIISLNYEKEGFFPDQENIMKDTKYLFLDELTHTVFFHDKYMNKICEHRLVLDPNGSGLSINKFEIYGKTPDNTYVRMLLPFKK